MPAITPVLRPLDVRRQPNRLDRNYVYFRIDGKPSWNVCVRIWPGQTYHAVSGSPESTDGVHGHDSHSKSTRLRVRQRVQSPRGKSIWPWGVGVFGGPKPCRKL